MSADLASFGILLQLPKVPKVPKGPKPKTLERAPGGSKPNLRKIKEARCHKP
jgi:hypothetical protein